MKGDDFVKKIWVLLMVVTVMSLLKTPAAWAAFGSTEERWYTVDDEEKKPFVEGVWRFDDQSDNHYWQGAYYLNDQTFFILHHNDVSTELRGSYLWQSGFFLGLRYQDAHRQDLKAWGIQPGYRWNLDRGYLAFSANYVTVNQSQKGYDDIDEDQKGLGLSWVYFPTNMKIETDLQWRKMDLFASAADGTLERDVDDWILSHTMNYQLRDDLVLGFNYSYLENANTMQVIRGGLSDERSSSVTGNLYELGFTWEHQYFILNSLVKFTRHHAKHSGYPDNKGTQRTYDGEIIVPVLEKFELGFEYSRVSNPDMYFESRFYTIRFILPEDDHLLLGYAREGKQWNLILHHNL